MTHWHFSRFTSAPDGLGADGTIDVDLTFALDHYPTARTAAEALTDDVINRFPDAKRLTALAQAVRKMPADPQTTFRYTNPAGHWVVWKLLECPGPCSATFERAGREMRVWLNQVERNLRRTFGPAE